jgi:hypothetical protein
MVDFGSLQTRQDKIGGIRRRINEMQMDLHANMTSIKMLEQSVEQLLHTQTSELATATKTHQMLTHGVPAVFPQAATKLSSRNVRELVSTEPLGHDAVLEKTHRVVTTARQRGGHMHRPNISAQNDTTGRLPTKDRTRGGGRHGSRPVRNVRLRRPNPETGKRWTTR